MRYFAAKPPLKLLHAYHSNSNDIMKREPWKLELLLMDVLMMLVLYCSLYNKGITVINGDKSKKIMYSLNIIATLYWTTVW